MASDSSLRTTVAPRIAIAADLLCLGLFVALGRESHGLDSGFGWFVVVLWPFAAGWLAAAAILRPYRGNVQWSRVGLTLLLGITLALVLRVTLTQRSIPIAFVIVAFVFNTLTIFGWRLALAGWLRITRA